MVNRQGWHDDAIAKGEMNKLCWGLKLQFNSNLRLIVVDGFF